VARGEEIEADWCRWLNALMLPIPVKFPSWHDVD
jgi:hypothetical protein